MAKEQRITMKSSQVEAVFSTYGAKLISWKLLPYKEHRDSAEPVELVVSATAGLASNDLALELAGSDLDSRAWALDSSAPRKLSDGSSEISFSTKLSGILIRKTFALSSDDFTMQVKADFVNQGAAALSMPGFFLLWGPGLGQPESSQSRGSIQGSVVQEEGRLERENAGGDNKVFGYENPKWLAQKNHYFVSIFIPQGEGFSKAESRRSSKDKLTTAIGSSDLVLKGGETKSFTAKLYAGPQIYEKLSSYGMNLQRIVQMQTYGFLEWLNPISLGMLYVMRWFYAVTGNWGLAIILLTALVRGILFYPSQKSMVSMRKMQTKMKVMQPRLDSIKKTYKDNPQRINEETMKLYKEYGVNPLGGCLPMLLQLPVMFCLYGTLMAAFELRGAPFAWRWTDLSGPDSTNIFGILMAASMFLQQYMAPTSTASMSDEQAQTQKMMMYVMPIMFGGMAIWFKWPLGLLLYWTVSNFFGIFQQYYVNKTIQ
jgi:YidC/Oxa1 family membrane protein insertase